MYLSNYQLVVKLVGGYQQFKKSSLKSLMGFRFTVLKPAFHSLMST